MRETRWMIKAYVFGVIVINFMQRNIVIYCKYKYGEIYNIIIKCFMFDFILIPMLELGEYCFTNDKIPW